MENQNEKNTSVTTEATASIIDLGMISKEEHDMVSWIIDYFSLPLLFIAVLFNFFNIAVYKRKCSDASTTYLISRGIVEVIYCLMSLASGLMSMIYGANATTEFAYLWYTAYVSRVVTSAIRRSAFCLTCIVTCQRCLVLAFPLRFRQFKISRFPVTVSLVVIVTTILLHIPQGLKYSVVAIKGTMPELFRFSMRPIYRKNMEIFDGVNLFTNLVTAYLPLFACLILDLFTVVAFKVQARNRPDDMRTKITLHREHQMTVIILTTSFVFVLLAIPLNINNMIATFRSDYGLRTKEHYLFYLMFKVGYLTDLLSNCTDFLIYFGMSKSFRQTLRNIMCSCCCCAKLRQISEVSTSSLNGYSSEKVTNISTI